jgi:hypothetical protein
MECFDLPSYYLKKVDEMVFLSIVEIDSNPLANYSSI